MDNVFVRTAAELERKYNLSALQKQLANLETYNNQIIKLQTQLNNVLKTLVINLGDTLQNSVSLWFYEGVPTTTNEPYIDWNDPTEHVDDFYYDRNTGYVYKYTSNGWERQTDTSLVMALALTNVELDVETDHERKVYLEQPSPPYSSGDWWIQEDGTLMICQIGKPSGVYEEDDFVVSTMYTSTIATKQEDTIEVVKGTITRITDNAVFYTDKATGKTTAIAGDSITTGEIKSANYVANTSGTKLSLLDGTIDSKNFKVNQYGNVTCNNIAINGGDVENQNFTINDPDTNRHGYIIPGGISFTRDTESTKQIYASIGNDYEDDLPMNKILLGVYVRNQGGSVSDYRGIDIRSYEGIGTIYIRNNNTNKIMLEGSTGEITCVHLTQTSQADKKKNFEKLENALDIINNTDIYKFNFKEEDDNAKKHIGFVIGDDFKYSKELTSNNGVDIYSFVSVCCKAIQEQQKEIEELRRKIDV